MRRLPVCRAIHYLLRQRLCHPLELFCDPVAYDFWASATPVAGRSHTCHVFGVSVWRTPVIRMVFVQLVCGMSIPEPRGVF